MAENEEGVDKADGSSPFTQRTKSFVEMCGRHPFATGLFALIGLFGLLFSFFQFAVDQQQNADDDKVASVTQAKVGVAVEKVAQVGSKVDALAEAVVDEDPSIVPVAAEIGKIEWAYDNISFPASNIDKYGESAGIASILSTEKDAFGNVSFVSFTMRSTLNQEFARVAPYVVADVADVKAIPDNIATLYEGGRGDGGVLYYFKLQVLPERGLQVAPLVRAGSDEPRTDLQYFKLAPREPEEAMLDIRYVPGYVYRLRLGLQYRSSAGDRIVWITPYFRAGLPDGLHPVRTSGAEYQTALHPDMEFSDANATRKLAKQYKTFVARQPLFNLAKLSDGVR